MSQLSKEEFLLVSEELKSISKNFSKNKAFSQTPLLTKILKSLELFSMFVVVAGTLLFSGNGLKFKWYNPKDWKRAFSIVASVITLVKAYKQLMDTGEIPEDIFKENE